MRRQVSSMSAKFEIKLVVFLSLRDVDFDKLVVFQLRKLVVFAN